MLPTELILAVRVTDTVASPHAANRDVTVIVQDHDVNRTHLYHLTGDPGVLGNVIPGYLNPDPPPPTVNTPLIVITVQGAQASATCADHPVTVVINDTGSPVSNPQQSITHPPVNPAATLTALEQAHLQPPGRP